MKIKKKISKKLVWRFAIFVALLSAASIFDYFFDDDIAVQDVTESGTEIPGPDLNHVYFVAQTNPVTAKSSTQKTLDRKIFLQSHDRVIQKYHQLRNYQVLKAEVEKQTAPLILSYHYLVFKNYFFTFPDDDPLG